MIALLSEPGMQMGGGAERGRPIFSRTCNSCTLPCSCDMIFSGIIRLAWLVVTRVKNKGKGSQPKLAPAALMRTATVPGSQATLQTAICSEAPIKTGLFNFLFIFISHFLNSSVRMNSTVILAPRVRHHYSSLHGREGLALPETHNPMYYQRVIRAFSRKRGNGQLLILSIKVPE